MPAMSRLWPPSARLTQSAHREAGVVEHKEPEQKKGEYAGQHVKATTCRRTVLLAVIALSASIAVVEIAYLTLAQAVSWPPFHPVPPASSTLAGTTVGSPPAASTLPSTDGVPADYQGTWAGNISGPGGAIEATVILTAGAAGNRVGSFQNETSGCLGAIYLESGGGPISLRIVTAPPPRDNCVLRANAAAMRTPGGLYFSFEQKATGPSGNGTLTAVPTTTHPPQ